MIKQQNSNYDMFLSVQSHFEDHETAWNTNIPIVNAKEKFDVFINQVQEALQLQLTNNSGITLEKKAIRERLEMQTHLLASGATAYAMLTKDTELLLQTKYTRSDLRNFRAAELQSVATNMATNVEPKISALAPYGITPETLATLRVTVALFAANISKPKESIKLKKEATAAIALLIKDASLLLKTQLDLLVIGLEATEPQFVSIYKLLRRLRKPSRTTLSLTTLIVDASTLLPIAGASLEVLEDKIKRVSSSNGINTIKNISEGPHELKVSHKDYKEVVEKFTTVKGETTKLIIKLVAIERGF